MLSIEFWWDSSEEHSYFLGVLVSCPCQFAFLVIFFTFSPFLFFLNLSCGRRKWAQMKMVSQHHKRRVRWGSREQKHT